MNQKSQSKFGTTKGYENPSVKMIESTGIYHTAQGDNQAIKKVNDSMVNSVSQGYNTRIDKGNNELTSEELRKAFKKLSEL